MSNQEFLKVPTEKFDKIMFSINLSEAISGDKVSHEEVMEVLKEENILLTEEQQREIDENYM